MKVNVILVATSLFVNTLAVNLEVPLYTSYAKAAGFGSGLTTLAFAAYVAGLLPVLIGLGGSSDRLGRRTVLLAGLVSTLLATVLITISPTIYVLFATRLLQGVGIGLSVGAGTAYIAELIGQPHGPTRAAGYAALTTSLGFGGGALITTLALLLQPGLVPISYWGVIGLTIGCILLLLRLPEYRLDSKAPLLRLPYYPPGSWLIGATLAVAWAVTGLVISVVPTQLGRNNLTVWSGVALFLVNGTGVLCQPLARKLPARRCLQIGFVLIPIGYGVLVVGAWTGVLGLVFVGAALAGAACYGFTYLGGLAETAQLAGTQRARAVSGYFLFGYLGFGLPSVLVGFLADSVGSEAALLICGLLIVAVIIFLAYALRNLLRSAQIEISVL